MNGRAAAGGRRAGPVLAAKWPSSVILSHWQIHDSDIMIAGGLPRAALAGPGLTLREAHGGETAGGGRATEWRRGSLLRRISESRAASLRVRTLRFMRKATKSADYASYFVFCNSPSTQH